MTRFLSLFEAGSFGAWLRRKIWPVAGKPAPPRLLTLKERVAALEPEIKQEGMQYDPQGSRRRNGPGVHGRL
jgi:hypothetical protein